MLNVADRDVYLSIAQTHADGLRALLRPGFLINEARYRTPQNTPLPSPFDSQCSCVCGNDLLVIAQFWYADRLWRAAQCDDGTCDHVALESVPADESLPAGAWVDHNSDWRLTQAQFLPVPGTPDWDEAEIIQALAPVLGGIEGMDDFFEVARNYLGTGYDWAHSRIAGYPAFIQHRHEPACPHCAKQMEFIIQLGPEGGYHWADSGQLYLFFCPQHPEQHAFFRDTH